MLSIKTWSIQTLFADATVGIFTDSHSCSQWKQDFGRISTILQGRTQSQATAGRQCWDSKFGFLLTPALVSQLLRLQMDAGGSSRFSHCVGAAWSLQDVLPQWKCETKDPDTAQTGLSYKPCDHSKSFHSTLQDRSRGWSALTCVFVANGWASRSVELLPYPDSPPPSFIMGHSNGATVPRQLTFIILLAFRGSINLVFSLRSLFSVDTMGNYQGNF